jgi:hypothetical protein
VKYFYAERGMLKVVIGQDDVAETTAMTLEIIQRYFDSNKDSITEASLSY